MNDLFEHASQCIAAADPDEKLRLTRATREAWLALSVTVLVTFLVVIDISAVNVAFPSIQDDFGVTRSQLSWAGVSTPSATTSTSKSLAIEMTSSAIGLALSSAWMNERSIFRQPIG